MKATQKIIYVKMIKGWGGFASGDVVRFGENKGRVRIAKGDGVEVPKQLSVNEPEAKAKTKSKPKAETATAIPKAEAKTETAEVTPEKTTAGKKDSKRGK